MCNKGNDGEGREEEQCDVGERGRQVVYVGGGGVEPVGYGRQEQRAEEDG